MEYVSLGCGKTTAMRCFLGEMGPTQVTLGVDIVQLRVMVDGQKVKVCFWDTAGQERFASLGRAYFRYANMGFALFDVTRFATPT